MDIDSIVYKINVAFNGKHDFTLVLDTNNHGNVAQGSAKFVAKLLEGGLNHESQNSGGVYSVDMVEVEKTVTTTKVRY